MGDEIIIIAIEVIQGGLFQFDFKNETKNEIHRAFIEPKDLFAMIGTSMQANHDKFMYGLGLE